MNARLENQLQIAARLDGGTCEFCWNESDQTWCLAGQTGNRLSWETDDTPAASRAVAEDDAADYLETLREQEKMDL